MALVKQKKVQAYIQGLNEVYTLIAQANVKAQDYKSRFEALGIDLSDTNITSAQITALNTQLTALNDLDNSAVAVAIRSKDHPSHGTKAL